MSKHDLQARLVYAHKRETVAAHVTIVFAALAVSQWIETRTGWSMKRFVTTTRRYRTVEIRVGPQTLTAADPLPEDLRAAIATITDSAVLQLWPYCWICGWFRPGSFGLVVAKAEHGQGNERVGLRNPNATRVSSLILVLTDSTRPFESPVLDGAEDRILASDNALLQPDELGYPTSAGPADPPVEFGRGLAGGAA